MNEIALKAWPLIGTPEKKCGKCKVVKPKDDFYDDLKTADRKDGICKQCHKDRDAQKRAERREANKMLF